MSHPDQTILVVEDEQPLIEVIKAKLASVGLGVVSARSAEQAWDYLQDVDTIRAIWLDHYLLGKENGLDFVGRVKDSSSPFKELPIIVVSNTATQNKVSTYLSLGIDKYFTKSNHSLADIVEELSKIVHVE